MTLPGLKDDRGGATQALDHARPAAGTGILRRAAQLRELMILLIIVAAAIALAIVSPTFRTRSNTMALLLGLSTETIVAIGMTVLLVSGGFDLSVGSTFGFASAITAKCILGGVPVPMAILIGLSAGTLIGIINGVVIAKIGVNPFVTTLAMMGIVRSVLQVMMQGQDISGLPRSFNLIGQGEIFGIQAPVPIAIVLVIIGDVLLRKSRFFRQNYYIGGNEKAAVLSGIPVVGIKIFNYALAGFLAALAGIVYTARLGSATVDAGAGLELQVISAVIVGGASLQGGEGTVFGSFLGSLLMAIVVGSLTLLRVDMYWNGLVIGATLLVAVLIDTLSKRRRGS